MLRVNYHDGTYQPHLRLRSPLCIYSRAEEERAKAWPEEFPETHIVQQRFTSENEATLYTVEHLSNLYDNGKAEDETSTFSSPDLDYMFDVQVANDNFHRWDDLAKELPPNDGEIDLNLAGWY